MRRIRTRLIVAILCVTLLPAIPLSLLVRDLLQRSFSPTLDGSLEQALAAGLNESRDRLSERKEDLLEKLRTSDPGGLSARIEALTIDADPDTDPGTHPDDISDIAAPLYLHMTSANDGTSKPSLAAADSTRRALLARWGRNFVAGRPGQVLAGPDRVEQILAVAVTTNRGRLVLMAEDLPAEMVARAAKLTEGVGLLHILRQQRGRILRSYVVPFLIIYGLLTLLAIGLGSIWARRIARPLEGLVASTHRVAAGDLDTRVAASAPGEVGDLVSAFNGMVGRLREQRTELVRLERVAAWRDLARTLAHEIKNPLTPILLAVQQTRDNYQGDDPQYREMLDECEQIVHEEVDSLRKLTREFSEFARLPRPVLAPGDLAELLHELGRLYGEECLVVEIPAGRLQASFDGAELRRALINLVDNGLAACAAAGRPERVTLTAQLEAGAIEIRVRDRGEGIPAENLSEIFLPNFSTKKEGMGLGLSIVESIVTGHGGRIEVAGGLDQGTTFTIVLPQNDRSLSQDKSEEGMS